MTNKSILISIQPKWVEKILNGAKTIEVRKTRPKLDTPFKCLIYCTKNKEVGDLLDRHNYETGKIYKMNGKVVGEFICDRIDEYKYKDFGYEIDEKDFNSTMLTANEFLNYGKQKTLYGWHISELKIYDQPKELSEFYTKNLYTNIEKMFTDEKRLKNGLWVRPIKRPPQSWCYVEGE